MKFKNQLVESLADAIGHLNGMYDPVSEAYRLRNPGLLHSFAKPGKHEVDDQGRRVFESFLSGYRAFLYDLEVKISGESRAKLKLTDSIENLLKTYNIHHTIAVSHIISFLEKAVSDPNINKHTKLSYFIEE